MVQFMISANPLTEAQTAPCRDKNWGKVQIEDSLEDEHSPCNKRSKLASQALHQWDGGANPFPVHPSQYNPLDEPSPLGLKLRKSPSLLELIERKFYKGKVSAIKAAPTESCNSKQKKEGKAASSNNDKLKASNFPASLLRVGSWEYASRYEGDLVAKCYFAKHKLVWEVLEAGLKSKIEIQWSDIMGLKADCPDQGSGTLQVALARLPLFFRETNPQPRKHTLWQATTDFTDGQASIHRLHFLQCPQGLLNKHFEKLIQCDVRLNVLSQQPEIVLDSPYFDHRSSIFEEPEESKCRSFDSLEIGRASSSSNSSYQEALSPHTVQSSFFRSEQQDTVGAFSGPLSLQTHSPSSVIDTHTIEANGSGESNDLKGLRTRNWEQLKVPGLHPLMSMSDLMNHIGNHLSEQMASADPTAIGRVEGRDVLEDIAQYLLSDSQFTSASDDESLMSRVNSLCCLLQDPPTVQNMQANVEGLDSGKGVHHDIASESIQASRRGDVVALSGDSKDSTNFKQASGMSRKESFGDLLFNLPRIASLPKFLFNILENGESKAG